MQPRTGAMFGAVCGFQDDPKVLSPGSKLLSIFSVLTRSFRVSPWKEHMGTSFGLSGQCTETCVGELPGLLSASICLITSWNLYSEVTLRFVMECVSEKVLPENPVIVLGGHVGSEAQSTELWGELC